MAATESFRMALLLNVAETQKPSDMLPLKHACEEEKKKTERKNGLYRSKRKHSRNIFKRRKIEN